ncbi:MAG: ATP-binding cassette domain-containing protein, partial [Halobacteriota archaeon]
MGLLSLRDLTVDYETDGGRLRAVDGLTLSVDEGSIVGLLGESGCGKSTVAKTIVRGLPENARVSSGTVTIDGRPMLELSERELRAIRWEQVAYVPQGAMGSLDPVYTV